MEMEIPLHIYFFSFIETIWGNALFIPSKSLNFEEWKKIEKLQSDLDTEYDLRREMLLTRLDVTIQSFQWSDAAKSKSDIIADRYSEKRRELNRLLYQNKATDIVELLAARDDLLQIEKTSSSNVRKNTQSDLEKHIIGMVPDRGGRGLEYQRPAREMPAWQKNRNQGHGNRGVSTKTNFLIIRAKRRSISIWIINSVQPYIIYFIIVKAKS